MKKPKGIVSFFQKLQPDKGVSTGYLTVFSLSLLFLISVGYFYFFGKGLLFYQENNSLFIFSADYLQKFTDKPGGLLVYAGYFLTQFYYKPLAGAVLISVLIISISLIINKIIILLDGTTSYSLFFIIVPSCGLILLQTRYDMHIYHILGFLFVLSWFLLLIVAQRPVLRIIIISLFPVLYYITGSFAIIFIGMYLIFSFVNHEESFRYLMPAIQMTIAAITFIVFRDLLFYQPSSLLLRYPLLINETSGLTMFLSIPGAFFILLPLLTSISGKPSLNLRFHRYIPVISILVLSPLTVFLLYNRYDSDRETVMQFEKMVSMHDWQGVIRNYENSQSSNIVVQYYYNLALSEEGELCGRMFFGSQSSGSLSLTLSRDDEYASKSMYFYYAIGLASEAHHLAYEQMVQHGYRPESIKMLIKTELIKGNFRVAERYINVLKQTLYYSKWAEKYEKLLYKTDLVNSDPELGPKIRLLPKKDFFVDAEDFQNVDLLLKDNPDNRIAFEYKMAKLLLEKDLMELGFAITKMKGLGYEHIPRHIEEAVVSLVNITGKFPDMGGLKISSQTDQRFIQYFADLKSFRGNRKLVEEGIKKADKNTFWYYLQFGLLKSNFFKSGPVDTSIY